MYGSGWKRRVLMSSRFSSRSVKGCRAARSKLLNVMPAPAIILGTTSDGAWAEADWHLESVADGAYALRARVTRLGGEHYDDYRVLGIERVRATELADGNLDVGTPAVDGDFCHLAYGAGR